MNEFDGGDEQLRRVHELLLLVGPPPELPPELEHPAAPAETEIVQFPLLMRRRLATTTIAVAALVLAGFGGGYVLGHSKTKPATFSARQVVPMHGERALAVLRIGQRSSAGNWPIELEVSGLPPQSNPRATYELWLTKNGKPTVPCGSFRVNTKNTTVRLSVPYSFSDYGGWAVTAQPAPNRGIGFVVLRT